MKKIDGSLKTGVSILLLYNPANGDLRKITDTGEIAYLLTQGWRRVRWEDMEDNTCILMYADTRQPIHIFFED